MGEELLAGHVDLQVLGDRGEQGSIGQAVATDLRTERNSDLVTILRSNQRADPSAAFCRLHAQLRQLIETVNSQLALQLHAKLNLPLAVAASPRASTPSLPRIRSVSESVASSVSLLSFTSRHSPPCPSSSVPGQTPRRPGAWQGLFAALFLAMGIA